MSDSIQKTYDQIPYGSEPIMSSHPAHTATIATLFGLNPVLPSKARILEIGCAHGDNILGIAASLPESTCVGIDLSPKQIAKGEALKKSAQLANATLLSMDILNATPELGVFDYIIAHGVFSWVSREVQDKILELCAYNLSENGLAYISYNTLPGWHTRGFIRDMMFFETRKVESVESKPAQMRRVLDFMASSLNKDTPFGASLLQELKHPMSMPDWYITHDFMAEYNSPEYFYTFMERCEKRGLCYVGDADVPMLFPQELPPATQQRINRMSTSPIEREQYTDFVRNRMFRRSILSKSPHVAQSTFTHAKLYTMYVASPLHPAPNGGTGEMVYQHPNGGGLRAPNKILCSAIDVLHAEWPSAILFSELVSKVKAASSPSDIASVEQVLTGALLTCFGAGLIELSLEPSLFTVTMPEKPRSSSLAKAQGGLGTKVTTLRHEPYLLTSDAHRLLEFLDGTRDLAALTEAAQFTSSETTHRVLQTLLRAALIHR